MDIRVLQEFRTDEIYCQFLTEEFDVKAVTSSAVQCVAVTEHLAKLSAGIALLDKELHDQVASHYDDLLSQATEIETLEGVLQMVLGRIQNLLSSTDRLRNKIVEPYESVVNQTNMLIRLQTTCDLLRRIIRILQLSRRLEAQLLGKAGEITKAAQCLNELDYLMEGADLSGLDVIDSDLKLVEKSRALVDSQAKKMLEKGLEAQNQSQVATALQVFYNLQILAPTVHQIVHQTKDKLHCGIQKALNVKLLSQQPLDSVSKVNVPGRAAMPVTGNAASFRASLWSNMDSLMNQIYNACIQVQHLQKVLAKKRDPVSHVCFLDDISSTGESNITQIFWEAVTKMLTEEFFKAANESTFVKQAFEVEFPKLLCMFNDLLKKLHQFSNTLVVLDTEIPFVEKSDAETNIFLQKSVSQVNSSPAKSLRNTLTPFENAYLSRCLSRLTDSVNVVFTGSTKDAPTKSDMEGIIKAISSELSAASMDVLLLNNVSKNVAETVNFVVEKSQYLVSTDKEAIQVIDVANTSQTLNATIVQLLHVFQTQLKNLMLQSSFFTEDSRSTISKSLESISSLINIASQPLLHSVTAAIEEIIMTMHGEDFSLSVADSSSRVVDAPCSLYMKELQHFINRVQNEYFSLYPDNEIILKSIQNVASRAVEFFVRHASLVRPVGDGGKMRLAADFAQMEMAITPLCQRIGDLGKSYRMLRSFRPLLFQAPSHIAQSPALGEIIPYSTVMHLLFARAPRELRSPHEVASWSVREYSSWLDDHPSEKERLTLIKGTLEAYVKSVKQRQEKEFCSVYPVMIKLFQKAMSEF